MKEEEALQEALRECLKLPESRRDTENNLSTFALCLIQNRPELKNFECIGDPYQHIKAYLVHELLIKQ
jgi:hypothetical protein